MHLRRVTLIASLLALPSAAFAQRPQSADRIKSAAEEYDAGRRAFNDGKYDEAAVHFENAFHDAPAPAAIKNAISSRKQAGHIARAAVLSALAQAKYPDDAATKELTNKVLTDVEPKLYRIVVGCTPACSVAADGRVVSIEDSTHIVVYLDPGEHEVVVGWSDDRSKVIKVRANPGGTTDLKLEAPPMPVKPSPGTGGAAGGAPVVAEAPPSQKPFGPWLFVSGAILTLGAGAATIASGVDTLGNPGADRVKKECVGLGEACPAYQQGLASQTRTNVLIGVTAGVGVLTAVVGIFLTQWSSRVVSDSDQAPRKPAVGAWLRPMVGAGPEGGSVGFQGAF